MLKQTMVHLSEEQLAEADLEATRRGLSRSALIRQALDELLASRRGLALDGAMQSGYDRMPVVAGDQWGDGGSSDSATRSVLHELTEAEQAAGKDPW